MEAPLTVPRLAREPQQTATPREELASRGDAAMVLAGCANKFIAYELGLGESTVSSRLRRAMDKLTVRSRAELQRRYGFWGGGQAPSV